MLCYRRTFCLVFALSITICYNSNVLLQFGILERRHSQGGAEGVMASQMKQI